MNFNVNREMLEKLKKAQEVAAIAKSDNPVESLTNLVTSQAKEKEDAQLSGK